MQTEAREEYGFSAGLFPSCCESIPDFKIFDSRRESRVNKTRLSLLIIALVLVVRPSAAAQDIGIILSQSTLTGAAGTTLTFDARLTNLSSSTIYLNGDSSTTISPSLTLSDNPFLNNAPLSLGAGANSGPFAIFTITIDPSTVSGVYSLNNFIILGGLTNASFNQVGSTSFTVNVPSPVPEPATLLLVGSGLLAVGLRRHARSAPRSPSSADWPGAAGRSKGK